MASPETPEGDSPGDLHSAEQLYSMAMLAELLQVAVRVVRRWVRADLLRPTRTVMQVPYFSFTQIAAAKQLKRWMEGGIKISSIERQMTLIRDRSGGAASLAQLDIVAEGKRLLTRMDGAVIEAGGQLQFGFEEEAYDDIEQPQTIKFEANCKHSPLPSATLGLHEPLDRMITQAVEAEDADDLDTAIDWYRTALAAFGSNPDICFQLAELLYRQGDLSGARERYFMALELDPELVEAQANLGCVLAETGQFELAIAAFEGALQQFSDYADVHFHLARALDDAGHTNRAADHWRRFLELAPASPWAEEACARLDQSDTKWLDF